MIFQYELVMSSLLLTETIRQLETPVLETVTVTGTILWLGGQRTFGVAIKSAEVEIS